MVRSTAFAAILLASTAVSAQETGTLITRKSAQIDYQDPNAARLLTNRWAKCVVQQSPGRVEAYLALPTSGKESRDMQRRFLTGFSSCISGGDVEARQLSMVNQVERGALFEALYERRFRPEQVIDVASAAPISYEWAAGPEVGPEAQQAMALARVGDCMVRKNPDGARQLMRTEPGTQGESQAIGTLVPFLGGCLPNGKQYQFSKSLLRGVVAEPLYKLSVSVEKPH